MRILVTAHQYVGMSLYISVDSLSLFTVKCQKFASIWHTTVGGLPHYCKNYSLLIKVVDDLKYNMTYTGRPDLNILNIFKKINSKTPFLA